MKSVSGSPAVTVAALGAFLSAAAPLLRERSAALSARISAAPQTSAARLSSLLVEIASALPSTRGHVPDIWSIVGLKRNEVRTARVLTWLLDPRGSHGAGDAYLQSLWREIAAEQSLGFELNGPLRAITENNPLADTKNRVDIEVIGRTFLLFIEVKIDAAEGREQLSRYEDLARRKAANMSAIGAPAHWAVLYLTLGRPTLARPNFLSLSWRDVARAIRKVAYASDQNLFSTRLALTFANHVASLK